MNDSTTNNEVELIIDTIDPLSNCIFLTKETWERHICARHPYMVSELKKVKDCIETPDEIRIDKDYTSTHNYYKKHGDKVFPDHLSITIVSVDKDIGRVKSALLTNNIQQKDKKYWPC